LELDKPFKEINDGSEEGDDKDECFSQQVMHEWDSMVVVSPSGCIDYFCERLKRKGKEKPFFSRAGRHDLYGQLPCWWPPRPCASLPRTLDQWPPRVCVLGVSAFSSAYCLQLRPLTPAAPSLALLQRPTPPFSFREAVRSQSPAMPDEGGISFAQLPIALLHPDTSSERRAALGCSCSSFFHVKDRRSPRTFLSVSPRFSTGAFLRVTQGASTSSIKTSQAAPLFLGA
jgi:hypothetical protein